MIDRKKILSLLAILFCFLCMVNLVAIKGLWYYIFWYFDMPMHFLGGVAILFLVAYVLYKPLQDSKYPILFCLLFTLAIGIGWEVFEYIFNNLIAGMTFSPMDTTSDIFFDMSGVLLGILIVYRNKFKIGNITKPRV